VRIFSFIFILFIIFLLAQPCQDMTACSDDEVTVATHVTTDGSETDAELCSPFCICSCCSHPVSSARFASASAPIEASVIFAADLAVEYTNPYTNPFPNSIWQPPKA